MHEQSFDSFSFLFGEQPSGTRQRGVEGVKGDILEWQAGSRSTETTCQFEVHTWIEVRRGTDVLASEQCWLNAAGRGVSGLRNGLGKTMGMITQLFGAGSGPPRRQTTYFFFSVFGFVRWHLRPNTPRTTHH